LIRRCVSNGKVHPRTGHESLEGEYKYSSTLFLTSALDAGGWSTPRPVRFTPQGKTRYPLYGRLGEPHGRSELTEVFLCFFLSCKANARVKLAKTGHGPHSTILVVFVLFGCYLCCSMYCLYVNVYCHRVTTQLQ